MSLVEKWNEHIVQGNRLSRELEDFEEIMHIADMPDSIIAFSHSGNMTTYINSVLSVDKMDEIKQLVVNSLNDSKLAKEKELEKLMGLRKPATINPVFEQAVKEMESQNKTKPGNQKIEFDLEEIRELYINQKLPLRKIAENFGCAESTVHKFVKENNITRSVKEKTVEPVPKTYPVMVIESVREVYTNGTMSLADAAKHFGVESNELHKFIEKHGIKKPVVKSKDPFLDANKMGKDEFKRKMLNSRK